MRQGVSYNHSITGIFVFKELASQEYVFFYTKTFFRDFKNYMPILLESIDKMFIRGVVVWGLYVTKFHILYKYSTKFAIVSLSEGL